MIGIDKYLNKVTVGDAAKLLQELPDASIDLTITSPPYGSLRSYNGFDFDFEAIAHELYRTTKDGGVLVWVIGDERVDKSESGESFRQALYFKDIGFNLHDTMIYMKSGPSYPSQDTYYQVFEYMFVLSRGTPKTVNLIKDRENRWWGQKWAKTRTRREKDGSLKEQMWYADEGNKLGVRFNIWQYSVGHGYHGDIFCHKHPASFPEALAEDHIISWSNPGDIMLDPLCGSGTTLKMAKIHNRKYIGFDVSQEYVDLSRERLAHTARSLFSYT